MKNEIGLILPIYPKDQRHKRAIIASVLGGTASSIIGLAYEGISSFLHHKRQKALHKAVKVMEKKTDSQHNKIHHLEDTLIMYGIYNSEERTFAAKLNQWFELYLHQDSIGHYAINSILFLTTIREKYVRMYE